MHEEYMKIKTLHNSFRTLRELVESIIPMYMYLSQKQRDKLVQVTQVAIETKSPEALKKLINSIRRESWLNSMKEQSTLSSPKQGGMSQ